MADINISISDFSRTPGSRKIIEGPYSGELFLNDYLEPKFLEIKDGPYKVVVNLDGTRGYATSFLEEVFGGLSRKYGPAIVSEHVQIISVAEPYLIEDIKDYILHAEE